GASMRKPGRLGNPGAHFSPRRPGGTCANGVDFQKLAWRDLANSRIRRHTKSIAGASVARCACRGAVLVTFPAPKSKRPITLAGSVCLSDRIVITGIGMIASVGPDRESVWQAVQQGVSG